MILNKKKKRVCQWPFRDDADVDVDVDIDVDVWMIDKIYSLRLEGREREESTVSQLYT